MQLHDYKSFLKSNVNITLPITYRKLRLLNIQFVQHIWKHIILLACKYNLNSLKYLLIEYSSLDENYYRHKRETGLC